MKRVAIALVLGMWMVGCDSDEKPQSPAKPAAPTVTATPAVPAAAPAAKPASTLYFETVKNGKTYVFANVATMQKVAKGEEVSGLVVKENFGPAGETVAFESDGKGVETKLMEEYTKQHPKK